MDKAEYIFASDFHIPSTGKSEVVPVFCSFLEKRVRGARGLYLLGDLFDFWIGRSMLRDKNLQPVFNSLKQLTRHNTRVTLIHGNRDFLLGKAEAQEFKALIAGDSAELSLPGGRLFLTHGDLFCTFDENYQRMRRFLRNPLMRTVAKAMPHKIALKVAQGLRNHSECAVQRKSPLETSLDKNSVEKIFAKGYNVVICGHFHTPQDIHLPGGGRLLVLSDWSASGGTYAEYHKGELGLKFFSIEAL